MLLPSLRGRRRRRRTRRTRRRRRRRSNRRRSTRRRSKGRGGTSREKLFTMKRTARQHVPVHTLLLVQSLDILVLGGHHALKPLVKGLGVSAKVVT
jgi:hypothetical protein